MPNASEYLQESAIAVKSVKFSTKQYLVRWTCEIKITILQPLADPRKSKACTL